MPRSRKRAVLKAAQGRYCTIAAAHAKAAKPSLDLDTLVGPGQHGAPLVAQLVQATPGKKGH